MASKFTPADYLLNPVIQSLGLEAKAILFLLWIAYFADDDRFLPAERTAEFISVTQSAFDRNWPSLKRFFYFTQRYTNGPLCLIPFDPRIVK